MTFVVTGGRSGLGEATAAMLEREGATAVIADLPETDVTDADAVAALVDGLDELHGVVNCAGIGGGARVIGFPLDRFRKIVEVNLIGTFNVLRLACTAMNETQPDAGGERGVCVNTASIAAYDGQIGQVAYAASKGGVVGLTLPAARDMSSRGIRVNTISPGFVDSDQTRNIREAKPSKREGEQMWLAPPNQRLSKQSDLTGAAVYFLSDASVHTTAADIAITGGLHAGTIDGLISYEK